MFRDNTSGKAIISSERQRSVSVETAEYLMIQSLSIKNFRCFKEANIQGLKRINLVVGRNATGKTALLESIFLALAGSPQTVLSLRHFRGMGNKVQVSTNTLKTMWEELGTNFTLDEPVRISLVDSAGEHRGLRIEQTGGLSSTTLTGASDEQVASVSPAVQFVWSDKNGKDFPPSRPRVTSQGFVVEDVPVNAQVTFFPANFSLDPEETSSRLSEVRKGGGQQRLLESIKRVFGDVEDISAEVSAGSWLVHVAVKGVPKMIPLSLHSAGAARYLAYLVGVAALPKSVVLIDEIENGLYYKTFPHAWESLFQFSEQAQTQLFVTTHSSELLDSVKPLVEKHPEAFSLIRAYQEDNEKFLDCFTGDRLAGALEHGFELR